MPNEDGTDEHGGGREKNQPPPKRHGGAPEENQGGTKHGDKTGNAAKKTGGKGDNRKR